MTLDEVVVSEAAADVELVAGAEPVPRSQWQLFRRRFVRHRLAVISLGLLVIIAIACFGATWIAPYDITKLDITKLGTARGPSLKHLMGTDDLGHDQLSVILHAGKISLQIALSVAVLSTLIGVTIGALAGFYGRILDRILSAVTDGFLVVPQLAVLAVAIKYFGHGTTVIIVVLSFTFWTYIARVTRGQVLSYKEKEFVEAARAAGASGPRIIVRHIIPNMVGPIMVNLTLSIAAAIVTESTLTFLGFGIVPPQTSWGLMLSDNEGAVNDTSKIHLLLFPGMMLLLVVLCVNFLGDGLRDAFDPQAKHNA